MKLTLSKLKKFVPFELLLKEEDLDIFYDSWEYDLRKYANNNYGGMWGLMHAYFGKPEEIHDKSGRIYYCWIVYDPKYYFIMRKHGSIVEDFDLFAAKSLANIALEDTVWREIIGNFRWPKL